MQSEKHIKHVGTQAHTNLLALDAIGWRQTCIKSHFQCVLLFFAPSLQIIHGGDCKMLFNDQVMPVINNRLYV